MSLTYWLGSLIALISSVRATNYSDFATNQLFYYKQQQKNKAPEILTTSAGCPVSILDATHSLNRNLLHNEYLVDSLTHVITSTIPPRVVHSRGTGAFGYFEVTHDISHICKAKLFETVGKKTPVAARFSTTIKGSDVERDIRGFAVKFYTEEGNFDLVTTHLPVNFVKDPVKFSSIFRTLVKNQASSVLEPNPLFDYAVLAPQFFNFLTYFFSDLGIPDGYRHMPGFGVHSYQVSNSNDEIHFMRFHLLPEKEATLTKAQAANITDRDYAIRDLYNAIAGGDHPNWQVAVQILTLEDVKKDRRLLDVTRRISTEKFPLHPVGKLVLDRNPKNQFAEVEQLQFMPSNLVPGIQGGTDKIFESRTLAYRLAGNHRLGSNNRNIPVNYPYRSIPHNYNRDGVPPVLDNGGDGPAYYPNSFGGPVPTCMNDPDLMMFEEGPEDNFDQIDEFYRNLSEDGRNNLITNLAATLSKVIEPLQEKVVDILYQINKDYAKRVGNELKKLQT